ncbi:hypothetical protein CU040_2174 [Enterococcus faecium]|nr:hypothetical protein [Enterococcus faecium]
MKSNAFFIFLESALNYLSIFLFCQESVPCVFFSYLLYLRLRHIF